MSFQSAVKRTWLQYEKDASIPWTKSIREDLLANLEYPIMLRDLRNAEFNPTFELSDNVYYVTPEISNRGNPILKQITLAYQENPSDIPKEADYFPVDRVAAEFDVKVRHVSYGIELLPDNLDERARALLSDFRAQQEMAVLPLIRITGNSGVFFGSLPTHQNIALRELFYEGYLTSLFANVMKRNAPKEQIIIRKSAIHESRDTDMKLPAHFFKLRPITYHFYLEDEDISLLLSTKDGFIQIIRVKNFHDVKVFHASIDELSKDGYVTSKTIRSHLNRILDSLQIRGEDGYEQFRAMLKENNFLSDITAMKPNLGVLSDLLTPSAIGQHKTVVQSTQLRDNDKDVWFENWMDSVQLSMKLFACLQDPNSKQIMRLLTREYRRGEVEGNQTKFKVWGINANLIKQRNTGPSTNRNRAHYVRGHHRRQPIKNTEKYTDEGYAVFGENERFFIDKRIGPHWRGNRDLGTIETIYCLGKSPRGSFSHKAVRWLKAIESKRKISIRHALNGGEQVFPVGAGRYIRVDGYCEETNEVFEFYGDYYHGNPEKFASDEFNKKLKKTFGELYAEVQERASWIRGMGFNLVEIWESDYDKM